MNFSRVLIFTSLAHFVSEFSLIFEKWKSRTTIQLHSLLGLQGIALTVLPTTPEHSVRSEQRTVTTIISKVRHHKHIACDNILDFFSFFKYPRIPEKVTFICPSPAGKSRLRGWVLCM